MSHYVDKIMLIKNVKTVNTIELFTVKTVNVKITILSFVHKIILVKI